MLNLLSVVLDGVSYGMLLFLFSIGLSITLGLMRFINLAHGAFAMCGGYVAVTLMNVAGLPFLLTLPAAFVLTGLVGWMLEWVLIRRVYRESALQQVLFSIGLAFVASAVATIIFGPQQQPVTLPGWLSGRLSILGVPIGAYRLFLTLVGAVAAVLLVLLFNRTLFGARIRAAVDHRRAAEGIGIRVERLFAATFALGAAMAGLGGALAVDTLGLDPSFPFKFLVIVLMIVAIGGPGSIGGSLSAALVLGVVDAVFKYAVPSVGPFVIYVLLVVLLLLFPRGLAAQRA
ncbi:MAG: branched-chain amino acid ABC transporter permease [Janthinobacterium lividum]